MLGMKSCRAGEEEKGEVERRVEVSAVLELV